MDLAVQKIGQEPRAQFKNPSNLNANAGVIETNVCQKFTYGSFPLEFSLQKISQ